MGDVLRPVIETAREALHSINGSGLPVAGIGTVISGFGVFAAVFIIAGNVLNADTSLLAGVLNIMLPLFLAVIAAALIIGVVFLQFGFARGPRDYAVSVLMLAMTLIYGVNGPAATHAAIMNGIDGAMNALFPVLMLAAGAALLMAVARGMKLQISLLGLGGG